MFHDRSFVHIGGRYVENIMNMDLEIHDVVPSGINVCMTLNVQSRLIFIYTEQFMLGCVSLLCSCHISKKKIIFSLVPFQFSHPHILVSPPQSGLPTIILSSAQIQVTQLTHTFIFLSFVQVVSSFHQVYRYIFHLTNL